ncbi:hypothetical protein BH11ACT3_BH11ACT3_03580 [soil metagenome]
MRSRILSLTVLGAVALTLAGCTFSLTPQVRTATPDEVAKTSEDALEKEVGTRPDIDCGQDPIPLKVNTDITCVLTDPTTELEFDIVITFTKVESDGKYALDLQVADAPNNAPEPTVEPTDPDAAPTVTGDDIAGLVVQALTPGLGFVPAVSCPEQVVQVVIDNTTYCSYDDDAGSHDVEVTITSFDGSNYEISAQVIS